MIHVYLQRMVMGCASFVLGTFVRTLQLPSSPWLQPRKLSGWKYAAAFYCVYRHINSMKIESISWTFVPEKVLQHLVGCLLFHFPLLSADEFCVFGGNTCWGENIN